MVLKYAEDANTIIFNNYVVSVREQIENMMIKYRIIEQWASLSDIFFEKIIEDDMLRVEGFFVSYKEALNKVRDTETEKGIAIQIAESEYKIVFSLFEEYLKEIALYLYTLHPDKVMVINKTLSLHEINQYASKEDLIDEMINKKVYDLMYQNVSETIKQIDKAFKLKLEYSEEQYLIIKHFSEIRNIFTHNRGLVNDKLHKIDNTYTIGDRVIVDIDSVIDMNETFYLIADKIYKSIELKLNKK